MRKFTGAFLFIAAITSTAHAQEITTALSIASAGSGPGGPYPSAEFRASFPTSNRFAVEPFVTLGSKRQPARGFEGFYGVQVRQRIANLSTPQSYVFAAYGMSGYYWNRGAEVPLIGQFGLGVRHRTSKYLAVRSQIDLIAWPYFLLGARFTIGVSLAKE